MRRGNCRYPQVVCPATGRLDVTRFVSNNARCFFSNFKYLKACTGRIVKAKIAARGVPIAKIVDAVKQVPVKSRAKQETKGWRALFSKRERRAGTLTLGASRPLWLWPSIWIASGKQETVFDDVARLVAAR